MIDFHCHILPEMDDGSSSLDESLEMARTLFSMGFTAIVATPHLMEDYFVWQMDLLNHKVEELNEACQKAEIPLTIYPGAELFLSPWILKRLSSGQLPTLNKSSYLLMEIPLTQPLTEFCEELFFRLKTQGYQLILAHPERCFAFHEEPRKLYDLQKYELLYQLNLSSLTGLFGKNSRKLAIELLKERLVTFVGSDAHHPGGGRMDDILPALDILRSLVGEEGLEILLKTNPLKALNNEEIRQQIILDTEPFHAEKSRREPEEKLSWLDILFRKKRR